LQSCNNDSSLSKYPTKYSSIEDFSKKKEFSNENVENVENDNDDKGKKNKEKSTNIKNAKVLKRYENPKFDGYQSSPNETLRGILIGPHGSGKTNLFTKITNQKNLNKNKVNDQSSAYGNKFEITDIPGGVGLNEKKNKYNSDHLFRIKLSSIPYNTIFVVIKFDTIFENILTNYRSVLCSIKERDEFAKKAVVLINNFDEYLEENIETQDSFNKKIIEGFSPIGFQNQIIFCSARESDPKDICDAMYQCLSRMRPYKIELTESEGSKKFKE
jgi:hypothetical protein